MKSTHEALEDMIRACGKIRDRPDELSTAAFMSLDNAIACANKVIAEKKTNQADAVGEGYALSLPAMLDLIDKHLGRVCSDYPRVDDAVYGLQEAVKQAAEVKP